VDAIGMLLSKDGPRDAQLAEALAAARESLASGAEGGARFSFKPAPRVEGASTSEGLAEAAVRLLSDECTAASFAPWSPVLDRVTAVSWRCALAGCEAAHLVMRCMAGSEAWDKAEELFNALIKTVKCLADYIRKGSSEQSGDAVSCTPFALGQRGVPQLWAFLRICVTLLIPVLLWCCSSLPKAGAKSKQKEGQEALHNTRVALRNLLATFQSALTDLAADLGAVLGGDISSLMPESARSSGVEVTALVELKDFGRFREQAVTTLLESHQKHLQALREALAARLALLKAKGAFKP